MQALLEAKKQGLTREIGISNFTIPLMEKAIAAVGAENIATNPVSYTHLPSVGRSSRFTQRISVLLPAPEAPITP